jgi:hypothetical protein
MNEGHNSEAEKALFKKNLAIMITDRQRTDAAKSIEKANRKKIGVDFDLGDMDQTIKMLSWSATEISKFFAQKLKYLSYADIEPGTQFDMFGGPKPDKGADDYRFAGMLAGMQGHPAEPPPNLVGEQIQTWLVGHEEGRAKRAEALAEQKAKDEAAGVEAETEAAAPGDAAPAGGDESYGDDDSESPHQTGNGETFTEATPAELAKQTGRKTAAAKKAKATT